MNSWFFCVKKTAISQQSIQHSPFCTCDLIANQLTGLDLSDAAKQAAELLLGHVLGQVVDNEVGLAVVICWASLHWRGAATAVGGRPVGCGASSTGAICHWSLHVTDDLEQGKEKGRRGGGGEKERRGEEEGWRRREIALISKGFRAVFSSLEQWIWSTAHITYSQSGYFLNFFSKKHNFCCIKSNQLKKAFKGLFIDTENHVLNGLNQLCPCIGLS